MQVAFHHMRLAYDGFVAAANFEQEDTVNVSSTGGCITYDAAVRRAISEYNAYLCLFQAVHCIMLLVHRYLGL